MSANFLPQLHTLPRLTFQWVNSLVYLNIAMENDPVVDDLAMKHGHFPRLCGSLRNTPMADCGLADCGCYGSGGSAGDGASAPPTLGGWGSCCVLAAGASKAAPRWQLWLVLRAVSETTCDFWVCLPFADIRQMGYSKWVSLYIIVCSCLFWNGNSVKHSKMEVNDFEISGAISMGVQHLGYHPKCWQVEAAR